ncbi:protein NRT1/ PTR FAMILY 5.8-like protein [Carex littledalei]|uniref:Protein NRT1/ PTR FAMILY 5.8-like protein n=1 Tax=Carex littledalei TaxID=544730 RepID=A0A833QVR4_9POAL|nr:protein NRT1/ PTR FAMILY 5.8-like protein [Carex littledalei]
MDRPRATRLSKSCILIIVVASVERFAYKGVSSNLVTYLTEVVQMSTSSAARSVSTWSGVNFMLPLLSAIVTDSFWDRYSVIAASSLLYVVGLIGLTSWALLQAWMPCSSLFLPLYLISIGQGGYNPSLQAFGADQLQMDEVNDDDDSAYESEEEKSKVKSLFFQWWYFGICTGSLLGNSIMSYVQDTIGWGLGFAIPSGVMALSVSSFICGARLYVYNKRKAHKSPPFESVVRFVKDVASSVIARKVRLPFRDDDDDDDDEVAVELELQAKSLNDLSSMKGDGIDSFIKLEEPLPSVAKTIAGLLPIWSMLLMFAVNFQQPLTFFTKQGMWMHHRIGASFVVPPAMLQSTITISIILLMPLYDKMLVPLLRIITREEKGITVLQRIGIGMFLSIVAMFIATLVESKRLYECRERGIDLTIFWLLPQYVLLGVSDVFTVVGMNEFFYSEVPSTMRTIGIALYSSVFGFGSFLGAFLIDILQVVTAKGDSNKGGWFSDDPREARLDKYYLFLAILSCISFIVFTYLSRYYNSTST